MNRLGRNQKISFPAGAIDATEFSREIAPDHYAPHSIPVQVKFNQISEIKIKSDVLTTFRVWFYDHDNDLFDTNPEDLGDFGFIDLNVGVAGAEQQGAAVAAPFFHYHVRPADIGVGVIATGNTRKIGVLIQNSGGVNAAEVYVTIDVEMVGDR